MKTLGIKRKRRGEEIDYADMNCVVDRINSLSNIFNTTMLMSVLILIYRFLIPLSDVWITVLPVFMGGILYGIVILKLDRKIHDDLKEIIVTMNLPWPSWL